MAAITSKQEKNVVEFKQNGATLTFFCVDEHHARLLAQSVVEGVAKIDRNITQSDALNFFLSKGPKFTMPEEGKPDILEHEGRFYINMGRPGYNSPANNGFGYETRGHAEGAMKRYGSKARRAA